MNTSYITIAPDHPIEGEFVDRKSRFIAQLKHVSSEREAAQHLAAVRAVHHDARHHVPAWILADGREGCSDDGEPTRTAGMPTLEKLRGAGLADVSCVVTRYFGGTLLGPGGLIRAYEAATAAALAQAEQVGALVSMREVRHVVVDVPYSVYERVLRLVHAHEGRIKDPLFAEDVQLNCEFLTGHEQDFVAELTELAAGEQLARIGECSFVAW